MKSGPSVNPLFLASILAATLAATVGFGMMEGVAAETAQALFFVLLIVSLASLVYSRHRPV